MKPIILNKYSIAAILLFTGAAVFIDIALISEPGEITTAAFVISALIFAMTGIFTLTFSSGEPVDLRLVGILPAQISLNFFGITHHLGMHGNTYFLPPCVTGEAKVMQFNSASTEKVSIGSPIGSFQETGPPGLVTTPSGELLIEDIRKRYALVVPDKTENVCLLLQEIIEDILKFSSRVSSRLNGNTVTIAFHDYSFIDGCELISQKSPQCCSMSPCPVCSLCGALLAEGLDTVVRLEQCSVNTSTRDITAVFSIVP
jgi:hypothetical protein